MTRVWNFSAGPGLEADLQAEVAAADGDKGGSAPAVLGAAGGNAAAR